MRKISVKFKHEQTCLTVASLVKTLIIFFQWFTEGWQLSLITEHVLSIRRHQLKAISIIKNKIKEHVKTVLSDFHKPPKAHSLETLFTL